MNLSQIIKSKGFTNSKVCEHIGVSNATMSNWRNNPHMMPFCKAVAIAEFIGMSMDEFTEKIDL